MIIKPPNTHSISKKEIGTQVRTLDIMPTMFHYAGINAPKSFIGETLHALMSGESQKDRPIFAESTLYRNDQYALRDGNYKLILNIGTNDGAYTFELYNIEEDPLEKKDISGFESEKLEELKAKLFEHFGDLRNKPKNRNEEDALKLEQEEIERLKSLGYIR